MLRFILALLLLLFSLLTVFPAPTNLLWYFSIVVTEFSWVFILTVFIFLFLPLKKKKISSLTRLTAIAALIFYALPIINAYRLSSTLQTETKKNAFFAKSKANTRAPFQFWKMFRGMAAEKVSYKTMIYDKALSLSLDHYAAKATGNRPCVIVVHGGSWSGGDSKQLPELNSVLAKAGFHVAAINYRLAPKNLFPSPIYDIKSAITFLQNNAVDLSIDTSNFILLGRSAGGQIVLSAADMLNDKSIKGVINIYGPADMLWGYANPTNPLVLDSRKIMEDYLGGTYSQVPKQYINSSATETANNFTVPTLSIYGKNDPLVSYQHGERLAVKLDSVHVKHFELYLPWATHGFDWTLNGPGGQISTWAVLWFLEAQTSKNNH